MDLGETLRLPGEVGRDHHISEATHHNDAHTIVSNLTQRILTAAVAIPLASDGVVTAPAPAATWFSR